MSLYQEWKSCLTREDEGRVLNKYSPSQYDEDHLVLEVSLNNNILKLSITETQIKLLELYPFYIKSIPIN